MFVNNRYMVTVYQSLILLNFKIKSLPKFTYFNNVV